MKVTLFYYLIYIVIINISKCENNYVFKPELEISTVLNQNNGKILFDYSGGSLNFNYYRNCLNVQKKEKLLKCVATFDKDFMIFKRQYEKNQNTTIFMSSHLLSQSLTLVAVKSHLPWYFIFGVFHSSVWSILLLCSIIISVLMYISEMVSSSNYKLGIFQTFSYSYSSMMKWNETSALNNLTTISILYVWKLMILMFTGIFISGLVILMQNYQTSTDSTDLPLFLAGKEHIYCSNVTLHGFCLKLQSQLPMGISKDQFYIIDNFNDVISELNNENKNKVVYLTIAQESLNDLDELEVFTGPKLSDLVMFNTDYTVINDINENSAKSREFNFMNSNKKKWNVLFPLMLRDVGGLICGFIIIAVLILLLQISFKISGFIQVYKNQSVKKAWELLVKVLNEDDVDETTEKIVKYCSMTEDVKDIRIKQETEV